MTRAEMIAEIRTLAVEIPKGLTRMRHAELSDLLASMRAEKAHEDAAQAPVGSLVYVDRVPGTWEVIPTSPAIWDLRESQRLLNPVSPDAKAFSGSVIVRDVEYLWTSEAQIMTDSARVLVPQDMDPLEIFNLADDARAADEFWAAWALDNLAEERGGHADGRATCYACGTWANHTHVGLDAVKTYTWPRVDADQASRVQPAQKVTV